MGHSNVRIKVRRRKVANLAAYSRQFTVSNNTIQTANEDAIKRQGSWEKKKYPQPKSMMKKHMEWIYNKETHITEKVMIPSTFPTKKYDDYQKSLWKNLGKADKMKAYEDDKVKKWEHKHPKPCPDDDLFKDEMIPAWEHEREQAIEQIRDFVVSMFDKLKVTASLIPPLPAKEILLATIKDRGDDKNVEVATKIAKRAMKNNKHILHCQLLDHKEKSYRLVA